MHRILLLLVLAMLSLTSRADVISDFESLIVSRLEQKAKVLWNQPGTDVAIRRIEPDNPLHGRISLAAAWNEKDQACYVVHAAGKMGTVFLRVLKKLEIKPSSLISGEVDDEAGRVLDVVAGAILAHELTHCVEGRSLTMAYNSGLKPLAFETSVAGDERAEALADAAMGLYLRLHVDQPVALRVSSALEAVRLPMAAPYTRGAAMLRQARSVEIHHMNPDLNFTVQAACMDAAALRESSESSALSSDEIQTRVCNKG